jgi:hypothetical protein
MVLTYNWSFPVSIGGFTNTISTSSGNVSLSVLGNKYVSGNSYIGGDKTIKGNLSLGTEVVDASGNYIDTYGNLIVKVLGVTYTISPTILKYIASLSSDAQTQINSLITNTTGISYSTSVHRMGNIPHFMNTTIKLPTTASTLTGTRFFWNNSSAENETDFLNFANTGVGGYNFYTVNSTVAPFLLLNINTTGNLIPKGYLDVSLNNTGIKTSAGILSNTNLGYLFNVSSDIQNQLGNANTNISTNTSNITSNTNAIATFNNSFNGDKIQIGAGSGKATYGTISIGLFAGNTGQNNYAIAIGNQTAQINQGLGSVAIGLNAGYENQGANCIAIGNGAGYLNQPSNSCYFSTSSIRNISTAGKTSSLLSYNSIDGEIIYSNNTLDASGKLSINTDAGLVGNNKIGYLFNVSGDIQNQIGNANTNITNNTNNITSNTNSITTINTSLSTINTSLSAINTNISGNLTTLNNLDISGNLFFNNNTGCILEYLTPTGCTQTITTRVIPSTGSFLVSSITIPANNFISLSFTPTLDFYESANNFILVLGSINQFKFSLNSITFTIEKNNSVIRTITQTIGTNIFWVSGQPVSGVYTNTIFAQTLADVFVDEGYLSSTTTYLITAVINQSSINNGTTSTGNYSCSNNNSTYLFNSSTTASSFNFSYGQNNNLTTFNNGGMHINKIKTNKINSATINGDIGNITAINSNNILSNNITVTNLILGSAPTYLFGSGYSGMFLLGGSIGNCNVANGGSVKTITLPSSGYYKMLINTGSADNYLYQLYFNMIAFTGVTSIINLEYSNPGSYGLSPNSANGFTVYNNVGGGDTNFYYYYMKMY